jgi:hypothetical protein
MYVDAYLLIISSVVPVLEYVKKKIKYYEMVLRDHRVCTYVLHSTTFFYEFQISELQISDRHFTEFRTKVIFPKSHLFEWPKV